MACADDAFTALLQLLCGYILDGLLLLGSSCGRCHMLDLATGQTVSAAAAGSAGSATDLAAAGVPAGASSSSSSSVDQDHDGPVTCISGSSYLQHFVTCSRDGYVKVGFGLRGQGLACMRGTVCEGSSGWLAELQHFLCTHCLHHAFRCQMRRLWGGYLCCT